MTLVSRLQEKSLEKTSDLQISLVLDTQAIALARDEVHSHPSLAGDLIINVNGNDVNSVRADASDFEPAVPSFSPPVFPS